MSGSERYQPRRRAVRTGRKHLASRGPGRFYRAAVLGSAVAITSVVAAVALTLGPSEHLATASVENTAVSAPSSGTGSGTLFDSPPSAPVVAGTPVTRPVTSVALPAASGHGTRVVFDRSRQRVWLVTGGRTVRRTYHVSGSRTHNLRAGRYVVYSRTRHATAFDHSSTMGYFVRFTHGDNAAIGFHDIPRDRAGRPVQTVASLGTPQSSGCIRQQRKDARALWSFAPVGTRVVVLD